MAVDPKARCVVACRGEQADGYEGDGLDPILDRARFACPELASVGADSGFAAERVWRAVERRGLVAYIPPQPTMPKEGEPTSDAQRQALAARARCKSEHGVRAHKQRMADAEGVIGELKNRHGLDRVRSRGTAALPRPAPARLYRPQLQTARSITSRRRPAASPAPRQPLRVTSRPQRGQPARLARCRPRGARQRTSLRPRNWSYIVCLN